MEKNQSPPRIILGIDPGTVVLGYGLICAGKSSATSAEVALVEMGVLQLQRYSDHAERLRLIFSTLQNLIQLHRPDAVAIEAPFFGKNVQSMLKLGRAQGVAMAAAMMCGLQAAEYAPRAVKQAVTGRGSATKEQVWHMLQHTLHFPEGPAQFDATDAVAVALCHHYHSGARASLAAGMQGPAAAPRKARSKKASSWEAYAVLNPDRLR